MFFRMNNEYIEHSYLRGLSAGGAECRLGVDVAPELRSERRTCDDPPRG